MIRLSAAMSHTDSTASAVHLISAVIPVYQGEKTLPSLLEELLPLTHIQHTKHHHRFQITEIILVHDCGPDASDTVIQKLATKHSCVRPVWLSRNFGQHPATLAGMSCSTGQWVVTMDEDGQQDPADIAAMLDTAMTDCSQLVYGKPTNAPPHGFVRNSLSKGSKFVARYLLGSAAAGSFNSFRFIDGEIARSLAAYCGNSVYLDVALFWVVAKASHCPVTLRQEMDRPSGYSLQKLIRHFLRLVLTAGTRPLRIIAALGMLSMFLAILLTIYALYVKFALQVPVQGWASIVIVVSFFSGCILFSLGIIAEYLAVALTIMMGKPLYLIASKPRRHPHTRS